MLLAQGLSGLEPLDVGLRRLDGTDLWHRTYRAPRDMRTIYCFAVDSELDDVRSWRTDPHNPRTFVYPVDPEIPGDEELVVSLLELPGAPSPQWSVPRAGTLEGAVELHRFPSAVLENERRVYVYTPPGYGQGEAPYPLLLLFDGWAQVNLLAAPVVLDNLIGARRIPPLVAVMPDSVTTEIRTRELLLHAPFVSFLADELLPWARERWRITRDPGRTVVAGQSLGGLTAAFSALERPDLFGNVLSQSGSFQLKPEADEEPERLAGRFAEEDRLPLRFYVNAGRLETWLNRGEPSLLTANRHLRDVLRAKGYELRYEEFAGGHDYLWWRDKLADGLVALLGRFA